MSTPDNLTPDSPLHAWAEAAILERAGKMLDHVDRVREGTDIEGVHDMRVASRRLAAAMHVFHDCFPGHEYAALLKEARRVTRRLGEVRDLDVLIDHFERRRAEIPGEALGVEYLIQVLDRRRRQARKPMLKALDELESSDYPTRLREFILRQHRIGEPGPDSDSSLVLHPSSFRESAPHYLEQRYHELYALAIYAGRPDAIAELHALRIKAKWLRYTMELFAPAYADELKKPLASVKRLQELLGDLHDADVRVDLLRGTLARPLEARPLTEMGFWLPDPVTGSLRVLLQDEAAAREGNYAAFYKEWGKLEGRGFREKLLERMRNP